RRRAHEADYFWRRWPAASDDVEPPVRDALGAELRAQLAGDTRGAASILAAVATDPLDGHLDFESDSLDAWRGDRDAFRAGPEPSLSGLRGQHGAGVLASTGGGKAARGELTSRDFRLDGRLVTALVGGGTTAQRVGVELHIDGEPPMPASGND